MRPVIGVGAAAVLLGLIVRGMRWELRPWDEKDWEGSGVRRILSVYAVVGACFGLLILVLWAFGWT